MDRDDVTRAIELAEKELTRIEDEERKVKIKTNRIKKLNCTKTLPLLKWRELER